MITTVRKILQIFISSTMLRKGIQLSGFVQCFFLCTLWHSKRKGSLKSDRWIKPLSLLSHCKSSLTLLALFMDILSALSNVTKFRFYSIQTNNIAFKCFKFHLRLKLVSISERSQANSFQNCFHSNEMFELPSFSNIYPPLVLCWVFSYWWLPQNLGVFFLIILIIIKRSFPAACGNRSARLLCAASFHQKTSYNLSNAVS